MPGALRLALVSILVLGIPGLAGAQDDRKTGLVIGYPTALGVLWHASDKVALRPEFAISGGSSGLSGSSFTTHSSNWGFGFGLSALLYLHTDDKLRTYLVPRFTWTHTSTSSENSSITSSNIDVSSNNYGGSGSFGAQYGLGSRFAVFGEAGVEVAHHTTTLSSGTTGTTWGTRAGVGVVFYP